MTAPPTQGLAANLDFLPCPNPSPPTNFRLQLSQGRNQLRVLCSRNIQQTRGTGPRRVFLGTMATQMNFTLKFNRNQSGMNICHTYFCKTNMNLDASWKNHAVFVGAQGVALRILPAGQRPYCNNGCWRMKTWRLCWILKGFKRKHTFLPVQVITKT